MRWTEIRRGMATAVGLLVLAFNVLAPQILPPSPRQSAPSIVVCTSLGLAEIDVESAPPDGTSHRAGLCAFCLPLLHGFVQVPAWIALTTPPWADIAATATPATDQHTLSIKPRSPAAARAPPRA